MTEPTDALLPCPFCGSKAAASISKSESLWSHDVVDWTRVHCTNDDCNAQTESTCDGYEPSAVEVWNHRTPPTAQAAEPVAYLTRNAEGDPAMLFFDKDEASTYCEDGVDPAPLYLAPLEGKP